VDVVADLFALVAEDPVRAGLADRAGEVVEKPVQLRAGVVRPGQAAAAEADGRHPEIAAVLLDEHVQARLELDERELVGGVAVDLVRREEDERRLEAAPAGGLQEIERADGVHVEVVEEELRGQIVRRLRGAVDDQCGADAVGELEHRRPVANVEVVVLESPRLAAQPLEVGAVSPCSPKNSRRRLLSTPWTVQPSRSR
jgi:hypothetical protein